MKRILLLLALSAVTADAAPKLKNVFPQPGECFMLIPLGRGKTFVNDKKECAIATAPASTFKIPHALIALETGVITDPHKSVAWDRSQQPFELWKRDHSLDSAIRSSVVWFFERTAAAIGRDRMKEQLANLGYTTDDFDGDIQAFWTNGDLVVSPEEQARFLRKMFRYELPVSRKNVDIVKNAMMMPPGMITNAEGAHPFALTWTQTILRSKTGNTRVGKERVSWLIGHLERNGREYVFVARLRNEERLRSTAGANVALKYLNALKP